MKSTLSIDSNSNIWRFKWDFFHAFFGEESAEKGLNFYVVSNGFCVSVPPNINFTFNSIQFYHISFYSVHAEHTTFKCKVDF